MRLEVEVLDTEEEVGRRAAQLVADELAAGRLGAFGVATGSSPAQVYASLAAGRLPGWDGVEVFALDEYVGLPPGHPQSYAAVIDREVRAPLGLDPGRVHVPDGAAEDLTGACDAYERALEERGGVDVQLLGIGATGHIGFNEPGSPFDSRTRVVDLTERTVADNARFFASADDVPRRAVTQGIGTIARARRHVLIALGAAKAAVVRAALEGEVSEECPASALRTFEDVLVLLDPGAASQLTRRPASRRSPAGAR
ncbi:glucosamine-6-phosphate deaminase [uncultured Pseudokineococcus sp.]|uniref:glucosamine-6-phosphate deaminase n=1 Tax=uncultured Pseudokineococcus sp. TaxID=1642928 RepID=UPI00261EEB9B|nr:glucosamine-6-phosphate deaminase [uncultured Pseudokineococcus sp.]